MTEKLSGSPMKDLRGYLEPNEVKALYDMASRARDKLLIRLLWVTGARISEILGGKIKGKVFYGLRVRDVDWKNSALILDLLKRKAYPPPKHRVQIDRRTLIFLAKWVKHKGLKRDDRIIDISARRANQILMELGRKTGLERVGEKSLHVHHLRHSHCVAYVKKNNTLEGLRKLQQKLGHSSIAMTAQYLQFAPETQKETEDVFGKW